VDGLIGWPTGSQGNIHLVCWVSCLLYTEASRHRLYYRTLGTLIHSRMRHLFRMGRGADGLCPCVHCFSTPFAVLTAVGLLRVLLTTQAGALQRALAAPALQAE